MRTRLPVLVVIVFATAAAAIGDDEVKRSKRAELTAQLKRDQILAEIKRIGTHAWAGDYFAGNGTSANISVTLAPSAGYVFEWHGCFGLYDRNYGAITPANGRLRLSFTFKNTREGFEGIAPELVVVPWGERRYLVPSDDLIGFCNHVNKGAEPRTTADGFYLLRRGDENKDVRHFPEIPTEYRDYLLSTPVETTVLAVGRSTSRQIVPGVKFKDTQLTLEAGSKQGLKVGMEIVVVQPTDVFDSVRITSVSDRRAEAVMTQYGERARDPKPGWRLSTRRAL